MYEIKSRVRYSEIDKEKRMSLPAILDYFQDVTTLESEDLGFGLDRVEKMGAVWMLSSWQVCVNRYPKFAENIIVHTWPYDFKGFMGYRNFTMETEEGEILAYANSIWIYLDLNRLKPTRIPKELADAYGFEPEYPMEHQSRKIEIPKEMEEKKPFFVKRYHIDTNQHVNNEKYVRMAQEYLPEDFIVAQVRAEYKKAAVFGDRICPKGHLDKETGKATFVLADEQGDSYAVIEFKAVR